MPLPSRGSRPIPPTERYAPTATTASRGRNRYGDDDEEEAYHDYSSDSDLGKSSGGERADRGAAVTGGYHSVSRVSSSNPNSTANAASSQRQSVYAQPLYSPQEGGGGGGEYGTEDGGGTRTAARPLSAEEISRQPPQYGVSPTSPEGPGHAAGIATSPSFSMGDARKQRRLAKQTSVVGVSPRGNVRGPPNFAIEGLTPPKSPSQRAAEQQQLQQQSQQPFTSRSSNGSSASPHSGVMAGSGFFPTPHTMAVASGSAGNGSGGGGGGLNGSGAVAISASFSPGVFNASVSPTGHATSPTNAGMGGGGGHLYHNQQQQRASVVAGGGQSLGSNGNMANNNSNTMMRVGSSSPTIGGGGAIGASSSPNRSRRQTLGAASAVFSPASVAGSGMSGAIPPALVGAGSQLHPSAGGRASSPPPPPMSASSVAAAPPLARLHKVIAERKEAFIRRYYGPTLSKYETGNSTMVPHCIRLFGHNGGVFVFGPDRRQFVGSLTATVLGPILVTAFLIKNIPIALLVLVWLAWALTAVFLFRTGSTDPGIVERRRDDVDVPDAVTVTVEVPDVKGTYRTSAHVGAGWAGMGRKGAILTMNNIVMRRGGTNQHANFNPAVGSFYNNANNGIGLATPTRPTIGGVGGTTGVSSRRMSVASGLPPLSAASPSSPAAFGNNSSAVPPPPSSSHHNNSSHNPSHYHPPAPSPMQQMRQQQELLAANDESKKLHPLMILWPFSAFLPKKNGGGNTNHQKTSGTMRGGGGAARSAAGNTYRRGEDDAVDVHSCADGATCASDHPNNSNNMNPVDDNRTALSSGGGGGALSSSANTAGYNTLVPYVERDVRLRYCFICCVYRGPRTHHCRRCDNCVDIFDHHCPWTGTCIGAGNYRAFLWFLFWLNVMIMLVLISCVATPLVRSVDDAVSIGDAMLDLWYMPLVIFFIAGAAGYSILSLFIYHMYIVTIGVTTLEHIRQTWLVPQKGDAAEEEEEDQYYDDNNNGSSGDEDGNANDNATEMRTVRGGGAGGDGSSAVPHRRQVRRKKKAKKKNIWSRHSVTANCWSRWSGQVEERTFTDHYRYALAEEAFKIKHPSLCHLRQPWSRAAALTIADPDAAMDELSDYANRCDNNEVDDDDEGSIRDSSWCPSDFGGAMIGSTSMLSGHNPYAGAGGGGGATPSGNLNSSVNNIYNQSNNVNASREGSMGGGGGLAGFYGSGGHNHSIHSTSKGAVVNAALIPKPRRSIHASRAADDEDEYYQLPAPHSHSTTVVGHHHHSHSHQYQQQQQQQQGPPHMSAHNGLHYQSYSPVGVGGAAVGGGGGGRNSPQPASAGGSPTGIGGGGSRARMSNSNGSAAFAGAVAPTPHHSNNGSVGNLHHSNPSLHHHHSHHQHSQHATERVNVDQLIYGQLEDSIHVDRGGGGGGAFDEASSQHSGAVGRVGSRRGGRGGITGGGSAAALVTVEGGIGIAADRPLPSDSSPLTGHPSSRNGRRARGSTATITRSNNAEGVGGSGNAAASSSLHRSRAEMRQAVRDSNNHHNSSSGGGIVRRSGGGTTAVDIETSSPAVAASSASVRGVASSIVGAAASSFIPRMPTMGNVMQGDADVVTDNDNDDDDASDAEHEMAQGRMEMRYNGDGDGVFDDRSPSSASLVIMANTHTGGGIHGGGGGGSDGPRNVSQLPITIAGGAMSDDDGGGGGVSSATMAFTGTRSPPPPALPTFHTSQQQQQQQGFATSPTNANASGGRGRSIPKGQSSAQPPNPNAIATTPSHLNNNDSFPHNPPSSGNASVNANSGMNQLQQSMGGGGGGALIRRSPSHANNQYHAAGGGVRRKRSSIYHAADTSDSDGVGYGIDASNAAESSGQSNSDDPRRGGGARGGPRSRVGRSASPQYHHRPSGASASSAAVALTGGIAGAVSPVPEDDILYPPAQQQLGVGEGGLIQSASPDVTPSSGMGAASGSGGLQPPRGGAGGVTGARSLNALPTLQGGDGVGGSGGGKHLGTNVHLVGSYALTPRPEDLYRPNHRSSSSSSEGDARRSRHSSHRHHKNRQR